MDVSLNEHNNNEYCEQFPLGSFLQSRFWKSFLARIGKKGWQLSVYDDGRLVAHCLLYNTNLPFGKSYLYAPKGPLVMPTLPPEKRKEAFELILSQIRDITIATRTREEIFCRLEPNVSVPELAALPHRKTTSIQPSTTIYRELSMPPEQLIQTFKEKTRYNIHLAERKGVQVHWSTDERGLKIFLQLLGQSAHRKRIRTHDRRYYAHLLKAGEEHNAVAINWASFNGKPIAANFYILFHPTITYLHGGFNYRYRQLMAPYLLQWEAMKYAYEKGYRFFDFWGYTPSDDSKPTWAGFSRFKEGFGGIVINHPGTFDFIYNPTWYELYTKARRILR